MSKKNTRLASRLVRLGKRILAAAALGLFIIGTGVPQAASASGPSHHISAKPMDGVGDSPLVP